MPSHWDDECTSTGCPVLLSMWSLVGNLIHTGSTWSNLHKWASPLHLLSLFSSVISQQRVAGLIPLEAITPICALFKPIRLLKQSFYITEHGSVPLVRLFVTLFLFLLLSISLFSFFLTAAFYCLPIVFICSPFCTLVLRNAISSHCLCNLQYIDMVGMTNKLELNVLKHFNTFFY